jgi:hypothetical protein
VVSNRQETIVWVGKGLFESRNGRHPSRKAIPIFSQISAEKVSGDETVYSDPLHLGQFGAEKIDQFKNWGFIWKRGFIWKHTFSKPSLSC